MTYGLILLYIQTILVFAAAVLFLDSLVNIKYNKNTATSWLFCIVVAILFLTFNV